MIEYRTVLDTSLSNAEIHSLFPESKKIGSYGNIVNRLQYPLRNRLEVLTLHRL
jgi:hypothetical protein